MAPGAAAIAAGVATDYVIPAIKDHVIPAVNNYIIAVAKEEFKAVWYLRDDVDKTSKLVEAIQGWREVAERKQFDDESVREWLSDFKNAVYDVEDLVFDHREMEVRLDGLAGWMGQAKDGLFLLCGIPLSCIKDMIPLPITPRIEIARRLGSINRNLASIQQQGQTVVSPAGESSGHSGATITEAVADPPMWRYNRRPMMGRDETRKEMKQALLNHAASNADGSSCSKLLVIGIVGAGGMGKTTLAHNIYNDEDVTKAFDSNKKWLYVGDKFNLNVIMNKIIGDNSNLQNEDELYSAMISKFQEKRVLIVLDDTWCSDGKNWDLLRSCLSEVGKPCALITTTRDRRVAEAIRGECKYTEHVLVGMSNDECMEIFKKWAFTGENAKRFTEFKELSKLVVEKLKGVPLAAEIMGRLLSKSLDDREKWIDVVNDEVWFETEEENVVYKITGLSYLHLPQHLRSCFAYCAIFPKGFQFRKEELVQMWIAQGYIHPHNKKLMERIGKDYFKDISQMSLLQLVDSSVYYTMHDLIHDFAKKIFAEGCHLKAIDTINNLSKKVRHLSIEGREFGPSSLNVYRKLRTLICDGVAFLNSEDVLANQFRYLRVLILNSDSTKELPDSMRHLKSLRYLDLSKTKIKSLPEAVCDLINLQCLILSDTYRVWPEGMSKLVNLRHLQHPTYIKSIKGIGKLTSLQGYAISLTVLYKDGWRISELKELNHLHGTLAIYGLKHVKSKTEAAEACLKDKKYLEKLELRWDLPGGFAQVRGCRDVSMRFEQDESSRVLEALSPPQFLTSLRVEGVPQQLPRWMDHLPSTLVRLTLDSCVNWERLPKLLGRLPSLQVLTVEGLKNVRKIDPEFYGGGGGGEIVNTSTSSFFPRLERFELRDMRSLEEWEVPARVRGEKINMNDDDDIDRDDEELQHLPTSSNHSFSVFPSLKILLIQRCPKLRTLTLLRWMDDLPSTVVALYLRSCGNWERLPKLGRLPSLKKLTIYGLKNVRKIGPEFYGSGGGENVRFFPRLEEFELSDMWSLEEWEVGAGVRGEEINMNDDDVDRDDEELQHLPTSSSQSFSVFHSLTTLDIYNCPKLRTLSSVVPHLTALRVMTIKGCDELMSLVEQNEVDLGPLIWLSKQWFSDCPKPPLLAKVCDLH